MGPVTLALGPFVFTALGFGYQGIGRALSTRWAATEIVGDFDALQYLGPQSDELTIAGVLFPMEHGGLGTLDGIRAAAIAGMPQMFVSMSGRVYGRHVIEGVEEDRSFHHWSGVPGRVGYEIALRRFTSGVIGPGAASLIRLF